MKLPLNIRSECRRIVVAGTLVALISFLTQGCSNQRDAGITGTYINHAGSEMSIASDTLIVEHSEGATYKIHRKTGFRLIDEQGKAGPKQHETEEWTGVYDPQTEILTEQRYGKPIRFSPDRSTLAVGRRKYQRIN